MQNEVEFRDGWLLWVTIRGDQDEQAARATIERDLEVLREHGIEHAPVLVDMRAAGELTAEARKVFGGAAGLDAFDHVAMVTDSTFTRVALNFILRAGGKAGESRFFPDPDDAVAWLRESSR